MIRSVLLITAALASTVSVAEADTLQEAMGSALATNPTIEARRARLEATQEALPQARSDILPSLNLSAGATSENSGFVDADRERSEGWSAQLSADQLLFASGRVAANTRVARAQIAAASADYVSDVQDLLLSVATAYAQLREAQAAVDARQKTADNLEEQRRFAEARFEAGAATRTDLAQAEARLAQARTQLIQAQGGLVAAAETYLRLVGRPANNLEPAPRIDDLPPTLDEALAIAVQQSPFLESARASEEAAEAGVDLARSARGPTVSLQAGTSRSGEFDSDIGDFGSESVGVRFTLPLFSGGFTSSRIREQRALRLAASLERSAAERAVRETVTSAWTAAQTARAAYDSAQEQVRAAELAYRGVRLEQEVGLRATVEALDQENDLLIARLSLAAAERELVIADRRLAAAIGALTEPR